LEIAKKTENVGAKKAQLNAPRLIVLSVLAGAFIALGAMFATMVLAGADNTLPYGISRLMAGVVFSLGLVLVVVGGAELFTGNTLMVMALVARKITLLQMLRGWLLVCIGDCVGALGTAVLVVLSGQYHSAKGEIATVALNIAVAKVSLPFDRAFFLGILCNVLVCLAVWLAVGARSTADKILAVLFPISAFVAAGFEHSVVNMYFVPLGLLIKEFASASLWSHIALTPAEPGVLSRAHFANALVPVTLGNIVGSGALVGIVYWFVYLRGRTE
jgi:formate/nitrite transporter